MLYKVAPLAASRFTNLNGRMNALKLSLSYGFTNGGYRETRADSCVGIPAPDPRSTNWRL